MTLMCIVGSFDMKWRKLTYRYQIVVRCIFVCVFTFSCYSDLENDLIIDLESTVIYRTPDYLKEIKTVLISWSTGIYECSVSYVNALLSLKPVSGRDEKLFNQ